MAKKSKQNRYSEILKAQGKIGKEIELKGGSEKVNTEELPIAQIKKDLVRTSIFAVLSIGLILVLHFKNLDYNRILNFFGI
jgi:hypothetical protein